MKFKIVFIGLITMIAGLFPLLDALNIMGSPIPTEGWSYAIILIVIGVVDLLYSFLAHIDLLGFQHVVTGVFALGTMALGLFPFLHASLPSWLPTSGAVYFGVILGLGMVELIYGLTLLRYG